MHSVAIRAFIQARASSRRFPRKVLVPFRGEPILAHVIRAGHAAVGPSSTAVVTSVDTSDDAVAEVAARFGAQVFRGPLENVLARFQQASVAFPSEWILRLSADSPLLDVAVLSMVVARAVGGDWDLVTTIQPRTFPRGRNAEAIRRDCLLAIDAERVDADEREHVTPYFYRRPSQFRILNVESGRPELAQINLAVDTPDDLSRLERLTDAELEQFAAAPRT